ncbi:4Fe-4S dicluster domain-containing protein [Tepidanaerobacter sp. GT38]|uniref:[Fe-Fe] hydrogenase large subunit C-terminal domain-containing protein n=1 Tax=Tepidanaerobacter sp. GT38 TaxID=2722793 RepID=UPI001F1ACFEB|nr:[Fe-Fe] hydrogenase large subunit C-terminal domain-containing protein [Tepidanaerobacter sp. GT38]MCG1011881.1 4Fe-4S dicluster domain-containing protein [Tepidanaerobacter sp. GT38]
MEQLYHSVTLDVKKCKGCTNCIKGCPTEAIRVRNGRAYILENKCIDCGECIRVCPNNAKYASTDSISRLKDFKFTVALPAPSLFGQFKEGTTIKNIVSALNKLGFDEVYQVPLAAEEVSVAIREYINRNGEIRPLISSSCPAVVRLIQVRFPELIRNIIPIKAPMEIAAKRAKEILSKKLGYSLEEIGVFFISPCPAKATSVKRPIGAKRSYVDGVFSISGIFSEIVKNLDGEAFQSIFEDALGLGIGWGRSGGENIAIGGDNYLAVDGIQNCIEVLEEVEMNKLSDVDYIECQACIGGCIGGALTVENQYIARVKLRRLSEKIGFQSNLNTDSIIKQFNEGYYHLEEKILPKSAFKLDDDLVEAIRKMDLLEKTVKDLPGLDCGSCGSPNCRALAEDIVKGQANETDCIFKLRDKVKQLAAEMFDLAKKMPPTMESKG